MKARTVCSGEGGRGKKKSLLSNPGWSELRLLSREAERESKSAKRIDGMSTKKKDKKLGARRQDY